MLKPEALAKSFTFTIIVIYVISYLLKIFAYPFFRLFLNSQFFGADIASGVPKFSFLNFLGILIIVSVVAWICGYLIASFYNRFSK